MDGVAAVSWGAGRIDLFWREADGGLAHRRSTARRLAATPSRSAERSASRPAVTAWAVDEMQVFAVFPDGQLWNRYWDGTSWHPWESLGGELAGEPAASSSWRGPDRRVRAGSRRRRLASLVGRDALGRLGTATGMTVELREITAETVRAICRLTVAPGQDQFVAPNAVSIAEAYFHPTAWFRAIYADGEPVGFLMLDDDAAKGEYTLWRLMIADGFQGRGYGKRAIELLIDYVRTRPGATALMTSWVPGDGTPEPFYLKLGFVPTGEIDEGEIVGRLELDVKSAPLTCLATRRTKGRLLRPSRGGISVPEGCGRLRRELAHHRRTRQRRWPGVALPRPVSADVGST